MMTVSRRLLWPALVLVALAGAVARVDQVRSGPYGDHVFRQTQTLFPILGFREHGIDLFRTYLPVFGDQQNVPFEVPLYQAIASLPADLGLSVMTSARLTTLVSFEVTALLWAALLLRWAGGRAALLFVVLFQVLPFAIEWGVVPLIDFFSVALGTACVLLFDTYVRSAWWWALVGSVLLCWLTLLVKVTTFPSTGMLLLGAVALAAGAVERGDLVRRVLLFGVAGPGVGVGLLLAWTHWADGVKADSPTTAWLTSDNLTPWNFAFPGQRTDWTTYQNFLDRISWEIAGPHLAALALAVVAVLVARRHRTLMLFLLLGAAAPPLIHLNLYSVHEYYLIAIYPVLVAAMAVGAAALAGMLRPVALRLAATLVIGALLVGANLTNINGEGAAKMWRDPPEYQNGWAGSLILGTKPGDRIVMVRCDWDPTILWFGGRTGWMITGHETEPVPWERIAGEYPHLIVCGGDPYDIVPREVKLTPTVYGDLYEVGGWSG
jgi:hypothetical protein